MTTIQERIAELVREHGSYRAAGQATGVEFTYLNRLAHGGKTLVSEDLCRRLGLRRVVTYERR